MRYNDIASCGEDMLMVGYSSSGSAIEGSISSNVYRLRLNHRNRPRASVGMSVDLGSQSSSSGSSRDWNEQAIDYSAATQFEDELVALEERATRRIEAAMARVSGRLDGLSTSMADLNRQGQSIRSLIYATAALVLTSALAVGLIPRWF